MVSLALLRLFAIGLLVAANAFFVAAEFALVSVRDTRLQQLVEQKRLGARIVQRLHLHLDQLLSAVQFGVTLTSLGLGWIGEGALAQMIEPSLHNLPHGVVWAHAIATTLAFAIISYLHVTLGELVPKSVALQRAERVALAVAAPMEVFMSISRPALFIFSRSAALVLRAFGSKPMREGGVHSPEELKLMVTASRRVGLLPAVQEETIHRTLELGNVTVREIMVPRPDIFSLPADLPLDEALSRVIEEQHSRVPVYDPERGPEHIIGVLYSKEMMRWQQIRLAQVQSGASQLPNVTVRNIMRTVLFVPETKPVIDLLIDFKERRRHMAVVVDEFGSTAGVITVEDVLEQIVGEIEDEFDIAPPPPAVLGGAMELDGSATLRDLETQYNLALPRDQGFETLGGFVLSQLQRIPQRGESFVYDVRRFTVVEMDGRRIARVKIEPTIGTPREPVKAAGD
jgi:putative hemolysin